MASVVGSVLGGSPDRLDADTVQDVFDTLGLEGNYTASVNGDPASMDTRLNDEDFVSFAPKVKGGASVVGSVLGGTPDRLDADTVQDVFDALELSGNYTASVNGDPATMDAVLSDEDFVSFAPKVKGGR